MTKGKPWIAHVVMLLLAGSAYSAGISLGDLADICEAMEMSIEDITVEYEWSADPAPQIKDIEGTSRTNTIGPQKCMWSTKRPFGERSLSSIHQKVRDEHETSWSSASMRSYDGEVGMILNRGTIDADGREIDVPRASVTSGKQFLPPMNQTPMSFSILRFSQEEQKVSLSDYLRETDFARVLNSTHPVNEFNTVCVELLVNRPDLPEAHLKVNRRIYFSEEHGYTRVRYEYLSPVDGELKVSYRVDVTDLVAVSEGIWFPRAGVLGAVEGGIQGLTNVYRASNIQINTGIPDEDFRLTFPPGTKVFDSIKGITYYVSPGEDDIESWLRDSVNLETRKARSTDAEYSDQGHIPSIQGTTATVGGEASAALKGGGVSGMVRTDATRSAWKFVTGGILAMLCVFSVMAVRRRGTKKNG